MAVEYQGMIVVFLIREGCSDRKESMYCVKYYTITFQ